MVKKAAIAVPNKEIVSQIRTTAKKTGLFRFVKFNGTRVANSGTAMKKQIKAKAKKQTKRPVKIERAKEARSQFAPEPSPHSHTENFEHTSTAPTAAANYQNDFPQLVRSDTESTE